MSDPSFTEGPWEYVPSDEHHGPYVCGPFGGDICDCYAMSNPMSLSVRNGGDSRPVHHQGEQADANARLIAAAPDLYAALIRARDVLSAAGVIGEFYNEINSALRRVEDVA